MRAGEQLSPFLYGIGLHGCIRAQFGGDFFQALHILLQLLELAGLIAILSGTLLLPAVERLLGNPNTANQIRDRHTSLRFPELCTDLRHRELFSLPAKFLP
jgi:hypothetical protein